MRKQKLTRSWFPTPIILLSSEAAKGWGLKSEAEIFEKDNTVLSCLIILSLDIV